ncbi:MAG: hypothetical protein P9L91_04870, partial [Candidatus Zophobacter franzmannii]|nr:hypothetical protein [Candidatus Zophobacter franzmannii]
EVFTKERPSYIAGHVKAWDNKEDQWYLSDPYLRVGEPTMINFFYIFQKNPIEYWSAMYNNYVAKDENKALQHEKYKNAIDKKLIENDLNHEIEKVSADLNAKFKIEKKILRNHITSNVRDARP